MLSFINLHPQECGGDSTFTSSIYMTRGFRNAFVEAWTFLVLDSIDLIQTKHVKGPEGADYLQVLDYEGKEFWCIDDVTHVTFLMPEDY